MKDLIERLRDVTRCLTWEVADGQMEEAADALEKLAAERDALRAAAKLGLYELEIVEGPDYGRVRVAIAALREVLKGEKE